MTDLNALTDELVEALDRAGVLWVMSRNRAHGAIFGVLAAREALSLLYRSASQAAAQPSAAVPLMVDRDADLRREMRVYLDAQVITGDTIGDIRRSLFVPWESAWNGWVRDETAAREGKGVAAAQPSALWEETPPPETAERAYLKSGVSPFVDELPAAASVPTAAEMWERTSKPLQAPASPSLEGPERIWCDRCGIVPLVKGYMPSSVLSDHAATDLICGECSSIIATLHHPPASPEGPQE